MRVENLRKYFPVRKGVMSKLVGQLQAVDNVSFTIREGETLSLVGESGCGKTTTGRLILRLVEPSSGNVLFRGQDVFKAGPEEVRRLRKQMQIIFQDPQSSLNPRMTVGEIVGEPLLVHHWKGSKERLDRVVHLLDVVGLSSRHLTSYPHEFSGGQRQRIGIARALSLNPSLIIADEPVSALDVSIRSQIINLLQDLQKEFALTYLFIAHDMSVVRHISDRVGVMYLGKIVELAAKEDLFQDPEHPYTQALLSAVPVPDPHSKKTQVVLQGDVPSPLNPPSGCRFHTRCRFVEERCRKEEPVLADRGGGHLVACHLNLGAGAGTGRVA